MSLKKNIVANYIGQAYKASIGIIVMPLYLKYLGSEAYGLIGIFVMLQAWMQLLDMGLRPTLAREAARFKARSINIGGLRNLLRSLEGIFGALSGLFIVLIYFNSSWIVESWLQLKELSIYDVSVAIIIMSIVAALRWFITLYRGIVSGFEMQVWLNSYDIAVASFRFLGVLVVFEIFGASIKIFFVYQLIVVIIESIVMTAYTYYLLPSKTKDHVFSFEPLKNVYHFTFSIAFTGMLWVIIAQIDKLLLSHILTLDIYGYFTLAVVISNGIFVLGNAIGNALMPRLTIYNEENRVNKLERTYFIATQVVAVIVIPITSLLVYFGKEIIFLWTHDYDAASNAAPILLWYTLGNLSLSFSAFGYFLQYAKGDLRLHVLGNIIYAIAVVPSMYYASYNYGAIGTGIVWFVVNTLYLLFWVGLIHRRFLRSSHVKWLCGLILNVVISFSAAYLLKYYLELSYFSDMAQLSFMAGAGVALVLLNIVMSKDIRRYLVNKMHASTN